jgi:hypothetical protein
MTGPRAGRRWTLTGDDMLRKLATSGMMLRPIAQKMKRSIGAIRSRIFLLKNPRKRSPKARFAEPSGGTFWANFWKKACHWSRPAE